MLHNSVPAKKSDISCYRAEINNGQQLRDSGLLSESCDVLFLYGSDASGDERELCWLEMGEAHGEALDELMDELPPAAAIAVIQAMQARSRSLNNMAGLLREIKGIRK